MLELLREFKECVKENPIEMLKDSVMIFLIFATFYYTIIFGSIIGLV
mgnify:CR=1 FL=1|jgi:hypothetical protein|tara:strand:+ start:90 stop:230 length:141 start_codon:yes stop_codon:yes gene_type:complete